MNWTPLFLLLPLSSFASNLQCPKLTGHYFCPALSGSHADTTLIIGESRSTRWVSYYFTYEERGENSVEYRFVANDEGRRQDENWSLIGKCVNGQFYVSYYGDLEDGTLLHGVNSKGNYEVRANKNQTLIEECIRRR